MQAVSAKHAPSVTGMAEKLDRKTSGAISASALSRVRTVSWNRAADRPAISCVPEETAIALTYNGTTHAVMMASPGDLEDYAYGFSLTEGHIGDPGEINSIDIVEFDEGIDLRIWLEQDAASGFRERRRRIAGPTGCGLCGIESLSEAVPAPRKVTGEDVFAAAAIMAAQQDLFSAQLLHLETRAVHAAGLWRPGEGLVAIREDVGRHNALDKLAGAVMRDGGDGHGGMLMLTSRVSVEMVQKAAVLGCPVIVAVSAPTALAVRIADKAGITVVASAKNGGFEVFTHPRRIAF